MLVMQVFESDLSYRNISGSGLVWPSNEPVNQSCDDELMAKIM